MTIGVKTAETFDPSFFIKEQAYYLQHVTFDEEDEDTDVPDEFAGVTLLINYSMDVLRFLSWDCCEPRFHMVTIEEYLDGRAMITPMLRQTDVEAAGDANYN